MKRFLTAFALTCALSVVALGADIPTCGIPAPAPTPNGMTAEAPGEIPTDGSPAPGDMPTVGLSMFLTILDLAF